MKAISLFAITICFACSVSLAEQTVASRVKIKVQLATEHSSKSQTVIFALKPSFESLFGPYYPKLRVLVLPPEAGQVPLQISLVSENGLTLSSTMVYFTPEYGAEFSLDADGINAQGQISSFSKPNPE